MTAYGLNNNKRKSIKISLILAIYVGSFPINGKIKYLHRIKFNTTL
jgi:hypothetical protein